MNKRQFGTQNLSGTLKILISVDLSAAAVQCRIAGKIPQLHDVRVISRINDGIILEKTENIQTHLEVCDTKLRGRICVLLLNIAQGQRETSVF